MNEPVPVRHKEALISDLQQLIMQKGWLRRMCEERCQVLDSARKRIEREFDKNYPNEDIHVRRFGFCDVDK